MKKRVTLQEFLYKRTRVSVDCYLVLRIYLNHKFLVRLILSINIKNEGEKWSSIFSQEGRRTTESEGEGCWKEFIRTFVVLNLLLFYYFY